MQGLGFDCLVDVLVHVLRGDAGLGGVREAGVKFRQHRRPELGALPLVCLGFRV